MVAVSWFVPPSGWWRFPNTIGRADPDLWLFRTRWHPNAHGRVGSSRQRWQAHLIPLPQSQRLKARPALRLMKRPRALKGRAPALKGRAPALRGRVPALRGRVPAQLGQLLTPRERPPALREERVKRERLHRRPHNLHRVGQPVLDLKGLAGEGYTRDAGAA